MFPGLKDLSRSAELGAVSERLLGVRVDVIAARRTTPLDRRALHHERLTITIPILAAAEAILQLGPQKARHNTTVLVSGQRAQLLQPRALPTPPEPAKASR